jgi:hypothetical protein
MGYVTAGCDRHTAVLIVRDKRSGGRALPFVRTAISATPA